MALVDGVRSWWKPAFKALRPGLPAGGLALLDSTTCKAGSGAEAQCLGRIGFIALAQ